jgi:hypothetical protein
MISPPEENWACEYMIAPEEQNLTLFKRNSDLSDDSDYCFLISLVPYMKQVSPDKKIYVRIKLQVVFLNEE